MLGTNFLKIFAKSPIKPMQQHMELVYQSVASLSVFFDYILNQNWQQAKLERDKINNLEKQADDIKKDIRLHLPNKILLPMHNRDFISLIKAQDLIANSAKNIANLIFYRKMQFPEQITKHLITFIKLNITATKLAQKVVNEVEQLIETGFSGNEANLVENMIIELDKIDETSDDLQNNLREELFHIENNLNPINAIFLYKTIDWLAELSHRAQHVGQKLELLLSNK